MAKKLDFTRGDHSWKNWFKMMWEGKYIQIFTIAFIAMLYQIIKIGTIIEVVSDNFSYSTSGGIITIAAMLIPLAVATVVAYKGFYQFWDDSKKGRRR